MRPLNRLTKSIWLVIVAQASCLALGLWMQGQFVLSTAQWTTEKNAWDELANQSRYLADTVLATASQAASKMEAQTRTQLSDIQTNANAHCLIVDSQWRVLELSSADQENAEEIWPPGERVSWSTTSTSMNRKSASEPIRGKMTSPQGSHIAVALDLTGGNRLVCFSPHSEKTPSSAALMQSIPIGAILGFIWTCGMQCVVIYLVLSKIKVEQDRQRTQSEEASLNQRQHLVRTRDAVIFGLAKLAESRDSDTGQHLERISCYATQMASALRRHRKFREQVKPSFVQLIGISSALHDIGKVGVQDAILLKPGKLTDSERAEMQKHPIIGSECLKQIEKRLGNSNFLDMARQIALYHHERWDGGGYPSKKSGEDIPLAARIVAIVDVYDALSVRRVYKEAYSHEKCVSIIKSEAGKHFDPELVEVFLKLEKQFREIARQFSESSKDLPTTHRELAGCEVNEKEVQSSHDEQTSVLDTDQKTQECESMLA